MIKLIRGNFLPSKLINLATGNFFNLPAYQPSQTTWQPIKATDKISYSHKYPRFSSTMESPKKYSTFTSEFKVRPDDIDMFNHVHNSTYFDYVLAARYEQMKTCYKMPMEDFLSKGYGWVVRTAYVDYKRPLGLGDTFTVKTGIETINSKGCRVQFEICLGTPAKIACNGWFDYVMIDISTGKSVTVSEEMIRKYSI